MLQLHQIAPLNHEEEKAKFFQDQSYNPQFVYADTIDHAELLYYGQPTPELTCKAEQLVTKNLETRFLKIRKRMASRYLTQREIQIETEKYLREHRLIERFTIEWHETAVARCSINSRRILFRTNADYTEATLLGVLNHEIGTHALRRINDEAQPWFQDKKAFGLSNSLITEEGLATLHQHLFDEEPELSGAAVLYLAVNYAQTHSFVETWKFLHSFFLRPDKLWSAVFRTKRGLTDTSQPGGFTKDLVYFKGAYLVSRWLLESNNKVDDLYLGKIGLQDVEKAKSIAEIVSPRLPRFVIDDAPGYKEKIELLARTNEFLRD